MKALLFLALGAAAVAGSPSSAAPNAPVSTPLDAWLYRQRFRLPDVEKQIRVLGVAVSAREITCFHTRVDSLASSFLPPDRINASIARVAVQCNGTYYVKTGLTHGQGEFQVSAAAALAVTVRAQTNFSAVPDPVTMSCGCSAQFETPTIAFQGSGLNTFIARVLLPYLKPILPGALGQFSCGAVQAAVQGQLQQALDSLDDGLVKPLPLPVRPPAVPRGTFDIAESPLRNLSQSLVEIFNSNSSLGVRSIVDRVTHGSGLLNVDLRGPKGSPMVLGPVALFGSNLSLRVWDAEIGNLTTLSAQELLSPRDVCIVDSRTTLDDLIFRLNATVLVVGSDGVSFEEPTQLSLSGSGYGVGASLFAAANTAKALDLSIYKWAQVGCWGAFASAVNFTALNATGVVETLEIIVAEGGLEAAMADLFNNAAKLLIRADGLMLPRGVQRILSSNGRIWLNNAIYNHLHGQHRHCQPFRLKPPHYRKELIDFQSIRLVEWLSQMDGSATNAILRAMLGPSGTWSIPFSPDPDKPGRSLDGLQMSAKMKRITLGNLDTFFDSTLVRAVAPLRLDSQIGIGAFNATPFKARADFEVALREGKKGATFELGYEQDMTQLWLHLSQHVEVYSIALNRSLRDTVYPHAGSPGPPFLCFMSHFVPSWNMTVDSPSLANAKFKILRANRPELDFGQYLKTTSPSLFTALQGIASQVPGLIQSELNDRINRAHRESAYICAHNRPPTPVDPTPASSGTHASGALPAWVPPLISVVMSVLLIYGARRLWKSHVRMQQRRRNAAAMETSLMSGLRSDSRGRRRMPGVARGGDTPIGGDVHSPSDDASMDRASLFLHFARERDMGGRRDCCTLRDWVSIGVPLLILSAITLRVVALCHELMTIRVEVRVETDPLRADFYDANVIGLVFTRMISNFWASGAYLMALLVVTASVVLPGLQGLALLWAWFWPAPGRRRAWVVFVFSQIGKLVFVEIVFMGFLILVIRQEISLPTIGLGASIHCVAEPAVIACVFSSVLFIVASHAVLRCHHAAQVERDGFKQPPQYAAAPNTVNDGRDSIIQLATAGAGHGSLWSVNTRGIPVRSRFSHICSRPAVVVAVLAAAMGLGLALVAWFPHVTWFDLVGMVPEIESNVYHQLYHNTRSWTLTTIPAQVPNNTEYNLAVVLGVCSYVIAVFMAPVAVLALFLALWFVRTTDETRRKIYFGLQLAFSCCCWDVVFIGTIAAELEINQISVWTQEHTVQSWCSGDPSTLPPSVCAAMLPRVSDAQLLKINSGYTVGLWILLGTCVAMWLAFVGTVYYGWRGGLFWGFASSYETPVDAQGICSIRTSRCVSADYVEMPTGSADTSGFDLPGLQPAGLDVKRDAVGVVHDEYDLPSAADRVFLLRSASRTKPGTRFRDAAFEVSDLLTPVVRGSIVGPQ